MEADLIRLTPAERRRALGLGHFNAGLWAAGNGLTSGTLLVYLAQDLGAKGLGISLILAAPAIAGVLRLGAPAVIRLCGSEKRACLAAFAASYLLILGQPAMAAPGLWPLAFALVAATALFVEGVQILSDDVLVTIERPGNVQVDIVEDA